MKICANLKDMCQKFEASLKKVWGKLKKKSWINFKEIYEKFERNFQEIGSKFKEWSRKIWEMDSGYN